MPENCQSQMLMLEMMMSICNKSYLQLPNTELWSCKQLFVVLLRIITIVLLTIFHSEFTTHL